MSEWISVKDRVPEEDQECLAVVINYMTRKPSTQYVWFRRDEDSPIESSFIDHITSEPLDVSHWMLFPDPPKED